MSNIEMEKVWEKLYEEYGGAGRTDFQKFIALIEDMR